MVRPHHLLPLAGWELQGVKKERREAAGQGAWSSIDRKAVPGEQWEEKVQQPVLSGDGSCVCLASAMRALAFHEGQGGLLLATRILQPSVVLFGLESVVG